MMVVPAMMMVVMMSPAVMVVMPAMMVPAVVMPAVVMPAMMVMMPKPEVDLRLLRRSVEFPERLGSIRNRLKQLGV